ncbi:MAG: chemotaxis protein CheB [Erythrobacter sp.]|uniref:chemotaxis protein CheB n=1 Tax=Erythrobacter sp. TaxID=1042 RepID=UPI00260FBC5C|nr:chemotaxis protein CheB [Erythrobacter sp.]MDJ0977123.1 chemotaxis protein CheB [Erythrobacter sp.]
MPGTKVMVVDDSAAMRALFCDILDNAKGVTVCGTASNADEARDKLAELNPDVLTLDVEMPGKSGMDFLAELMEERPMPVIMLSSITQAGTGTAQRALELGAVHCFPKPLHSSREEFDATVKELGGIVIKAANGELQSGGGSQEAGAAADYSPGDKLLALGCGQAGLEAAKGLLAAFPSNCPPIVLVVDAEAEQVERAITSMRGSLACEIETAVDGMALTPGRAYVAYDRSRHVIIEAGEPPRLRLVERDPVSGFRPSADLLLGSIARAGLPAVGGLLLGAGSDGAKGLQIFSASGHTTFVQTPPDYAPRDRYEAVRVLGLEAVELKAEQMGSWLLERTAAYTG